jgi:hypothetical protein
MLGTTRHLITPYIRDVWLAIRLSRCWLISYEDVIASKDHIRKFDSDGLEPLSKTGRFHLKQQEIIVTRPGVLTSVAHIAASARIGQAGIYRYVERGLKAQRIGSEVLVYEDDWEDFLRQEWARPRLRHPDWLPKPEEAIVGPIIPSPYIGKTKEELMQQKLAGWAAWYAAQLLMGEPPEIPMPRTRRVRRKYGFPSSGQLNGGE